MSRKLISDEIQWSIFHGISVTLGSFPSRKKCKKKQSESSTYRPREVKRKLDGLVSFPMSFPDIVIPQHSGEFVAIRAGRRRVDLGLVLLETDAKPRATSARTDAGRRRFLAAATVADAVLAVVVDERLESQFEHPGATHLNTHTQTHTTRFSFEYREQQQQHELVLVFYYYTNRVR